MAHHGFAKKIDQAWFQLGAPVYALMLRCLAGVLFCNYLTWLPFLDSYLVENQIDFSAAQRSIFALFNDPVWSGIVILLGLCLSVGLFWLRWVKILLVVHLIIISSLQSITPFSASADYAVLCQMIIWILLMPGKADKEGNYIGYAVFGLRLQLGLIYFCGVIYKGYDPWWVNGHALFVSLMKLQYSSELGVYLATHIPLPILKFGTHSVVLIEALALPLILMPYKAVWVRRALFVALASFHFGTFFLFDILMFPFLMIAYLVCILDSKILLLLTPKFLMGKKNGTVLSERRKDLL